MAKVSRIVAALLLFVMFFGGWDGFAGHGVAVAAGKGKLVCLVSEVKGEVWLATAETPRQPLEVFTRLREGERLEMATGASLKLAFLAKGQGETWTGPATILITADGGQSPDSPNAPVVDKLPLPPRLASSQASSILLQEGEQATAQVRTRGADLPEDRPLTDAERQELEGVQRTVADLRAKAAPNDVGPDILLLEELTRLGQRRWLGEELKRLREAHPDNTALAGWQ